MIPGKRGADTLQGIVRPLAEGDREQWRRLWDGYNTFYRRSIPEEVTRITWTRLLEGEEAMHALVFESVEGRHATILGLPLLELLAVLRRLGAVGL